MAFQYRGSVQSIGDRARLPRDRLVARRRPSRTDAYGLTELASRLGSNAAERATGPRRPGQSAGGDPETLGQVIRMAS